MKKPALTSAAFPGRRVTGPARRLIFAALGLEAILAAWPLSGGAQILNDPTRPPASAIPAAPAGEGRTGSPQLQSVMISAAERVAIISGERVKEGGKYGDARVTRITESEVVLRSASSTETLRLYPDVDMKLVKPAAAVAAPKAAPKPARKPQVKSNNARRKPR